MNTLFLHVGPHKTGTTSIQKFLLDNQDTLFKTGLIYPKRFQQIFGHHKFRELLDKKALSREDLSFFNDTEQDFLLSSEDLISLGKDKFEYLRYALESKKIVVIYAWRRASFKLYSIWQETVKHGSTESFFSYYHNHLARPAQSQMLSPDLKLGMFSHVFGKDNVKVLDYDASSQNDSLLENFLQICNVQWQDSFITPENNADAVNRSMDFTDIEVIRALNYQFRDQVSIEGSWVRTRYSKQLSTLNNSGLVRLKEIIARNSQDFKVGNYFIDHRGEKIMIDKYEDNILNYQQCMSIRSLKLAMSEWVFDVEAQSILQDLTKVMKEAVT
jgi:hypothetical protein